VQISFQASVSLQIQFSELVIFSWCDLCSSSKPPTTKKKKKIIKSQLMDPGLIERKKRLLQELYCILTELEEISVAEEIAEKLVDPVVPFEHLCQPAEKTEQLDIPAAKEQGMHDYIEQWFQSSLQLSDALLLQQFLEITQPVLLTQHTLVTMHIYMLSKGMNLFLILLRWWLHWLFAYT
jgi:hypothetical protein